MSGDLLDGRRVVACDIDSGRLGEFHIPTARVVGDSAEVARAILALIDEAEIPSTGFRARVVDQIESISPAPIPPTVDGPLDLGPVLRWLEEILPRDRVLVLDSGAFMVDALKQATVQAPRDFVLTTAFGSIGLGMGHAVGAAEAAGGRPTVLLTGDGGFMLGGLAEFNTAVRHGQDVIVIVLNNSSYGPEYVHLQARGLDVGLSLFEWPDFAPLATALGGDGLTVRSRADLALIGPAVAARRGPLLIDVLIDPDRTVLVNEPG